MVFTLSDSEWLVPGPVGCNSQLIILLYNPFPPMKPVVLWRKNMLLGNACKPKLSAPPAAVLIQERHQGCLRWCKNKVTPHVAIEQRVFVIHIQRLYRLSISAYAYFQDPVVCSRVQRKRMHGPPCNG